MKKSKLIKELQLFVTLFLFAILFGNTVNAQWSQTGLPSGSFNTIFTNGGDLLAGLNATGSVVLSSNNGINWSYVNSGISPGADVRAFGSNSLYVFVGTQSGIFRCNNDGLYNWNLILGGGFWSLLVTDTDIYAGSIGSGVFHSTDNGVNWTSSTTGMQLYPYAYTLATNGTYIFAGMYAGNGTSNSPNAGVYRSGDNGVTWTQKANGLTNYDVFSLLIKGNYLFAGTNAGVFRSSDNGDNWTFLAGGSVHSLKVTCGSDIYAGLLNNGGVSHSTDNGNTWTGYNGGNNWYTSAVTSLTVLGSQMFAATLGTGIYKSDIVCSDSSSSICGMKFNDLNGNANKDSGDLGLPGWVINLTYQNAAGSITLSDTTDQDGNYCFTDLQPGITYTVSETQQLGWTQTTPAAPGEYTIILTDGVDTTNIDFGNTATSSCIEPPSDMVAWWTMDEISGTTVRDIVGGFDGTALPADIGTATGPVTSTSGSWTSNFPVGMVDNSLYFYGDRHIEVPHNTTLDLSNQSFTVDAWVIYHAAANGQSMTILKKKNGVSPGYHMYIDDASISTGYLNFNANSSANGSGAIVYQTALTPDVWHHVAFTYNITSGAAALYLDGVKKVWAPHTMGIIANTENLFIGGNGISQGDIAVDEVEFFNRALDETEIYDLWEAGSAGKCKPADSCQGTQAWSSLGTGINNGTNGEVWALAVIGSDLYVGGNFTTAGGNTVNNIAKWNGSSWSALISSNGVNGLNGTVAALAVIGTDLYVGGWFTTAGGVQAENIAKWDGTNWSPLGSGLSAAGTINALATMGNDLYATSYILDPALGGPGNLIVKWDGSNWMPFSVMDDYVSSFLVDGSDLYAGGQFTMAGTVPANKIAKWDGTNWSPLGTGMNFFIGGNGLVKMAGNLYASGRFTTAGGNPANFIAKWDGSTWSPFISGSNNGMNNEVEGLVVMGVDLYASGSFTNAVGVSANSVAKWDGTNWSPLGSGMNDGVWRLAVIGQDLYAGGIFTTAGGVTANYIAKYSCNVTTFIDEDISGNVIPKSFQLHQNFPNPFNPSTTIRYSVPKQSLVKIVVYDILGREVKVFVNEQKNAGHYEVSFDARGLASGIYFYTIRSGEITQTKKMILLK